MTDDNYESSDVRHMRATFNSPIAPERSCSDKRGMNNKAMKLKLFCFYTCILTSTREMIKYFASLFCGEATSKI